MKDIKDNRSLEREVMHQVCLCPYILLDHHCLVPFGMWNRSLHSYDNWVQNDGQLLWHLMFGAYIPQIDPFEGYGAV